MQTRRFQEKKSLSIDQSDIDRRAFEKFSKFFIDDRKKKTNSRRLGHNRHRQTRAPPRCSRPNSQVFLFVPLLFSRCALRYDVRCSCKLARSQVLLPPRALEDEPLWICNRFNSIGVSRLPPREGHAYARGGASLSKLFLEIVRSRSVSLSSVS